MNKIYTRHFGWTITMKKKSIKSTKSVEQLVNPLDSQPLVNNYCTLVVYAKTKLKKELFWTNKVFFLIIQL